MPQGSVLGPLLFILYVNDIVSVINHSAHYLYADDLAIVTSFKSPEIMARLLQDDLNNIGTWCQNNLLTVNTCTKTTQVLWCYPLCYRLALDYCDVELCGNVLTRVKEFKLTT